MLVSLFAIMSMAVSADIIEYITDDGFMYRLDTEAKTAELATYNGKIDIETNDGGYVKFDFNGKRYIYYNCFVESIADID